MPLKTTRWRPDTCACVFEYAWDDAEPQDTRALAFARRLEACAVHEGAPPEAAFGHAREENRRKNVAVGALLAAAAARRGVERVADPAAVCAWALEGSPPRRVRVTVRDPLLTPADRDAAAAEIAAALGPGAAIVE
ncbi:MAG TPA: hypothetical protein VJ253_05890 [Dehalococcoidia bacterium]|nr:hypothetical protein [Dehalococcoidia bacterium]